MLRTKFKSIAHRVGTVTVAALLLMLSAAMLTFGFFLSLSLLVIAIVWGLLGRNRTTSPDDSVIDLSKADYQNVSQ